MPDDLTKETIFRTSLRPWRLDNNPRRKRSKLILFKMNSPQKSSVDVQDTQEDSVSMVDVLRVEEQLEDDANAVLGGSEDKVCTYDAGYLPRQALYACRTCKMKDSEAQAGICLACSLECHDGHILIELYTKRDFRCDCGTAKFASSPACKFVGTDKIRSENVNNRYNHNYKGLYCICNRPYPDPEEDVNDEMIQCNICEDWFHSLHLEGSDKTKLDLDFEEMTCQLCMDKCGFLENYRQWFLKMSKKSSCNVIADKIDDETCCLPEIVESSAEKGKAQAMFWPSSWRDKLCKCHKCRQLYSSNEVEFFMNADDSVHAYEERGKLKRQSSYDKNLNTLSEMPHVQQVELLHGYNEFKTELSNYLRKFAENGKVVRQEDIQEFFEGLTERKKRKTAAAIPSHFCR